MRRPACSRKALSRLGGGLLGAALAAPLVAAQTGAQLTFGVETGVEAGRNLALDLPEAGTSLLSETRLSFGYLSETPTQRLAIEGSGLLRFGRDDDERISEVGEPAGRIAYRRESRASLLDLDASLSSGRIDSLRFDDFTNPETGEIELPSDFDNLNGQGTRQSLSASARMEFGRDGPWGLTLAASGSLLRYRDVTDPDLVDTDELTFGARTRLELSPVLTAGLGVERSLYRADLVPGDITSIREQTTDRVDVTLAYQVSPRLLMDLGLGYSTIETRRDIGRTREEGFVGSLGFTLAMPDGALTGSITEDQTEDGSRTTAQIGRSLELPLGALSGSLGLTRGPSGDENLIGSLAWTRELPRGLFSARFSREIDSSDRDEGDRLRTLVGLGYQHEINPVSSLSLGLDLSVSDTTDFGDRNERSDFSAVYSRQLTPEWALNSGFRYRMRRDAGESRRESPSVFLNLGRQFAFGL